MESTPLGLLSSLMPQVSTHALIKVPRAAPMAVEAVVAVEEVVENTSPSAARMEAVEEAVEAEAVVESLAPQALLVALLLPSSFGLPM